MSSVETPKSDSWLTRFLVMFLFSVLWNLIDGSEKLCFSLYFKSTCEIMASWLRIIIHYHAQYMVILMKTHDNLDFGQWNKMILSIRRMNMIQDFNGQLWVEFA